MSLTDYHKYPCQNDWPLPADVQNIKDDLEIRGKETRYSELMDTPDNKNCATKILHFMKYGAVGGYAFAIMDVAVVTKPQTVLGKAMRLHKIGTPIVAMGAAYSTTVCAVSVMRKKDDQLNHIIAGFMAGSIWGMRTRSQLKGIIVGGLIGIGGAAFKSAYMYDWPLQIGNLKRRDYLGFHHYDRSLLIPNEPRRQVESDEALKLP